VLLRRFPPRGGGYYVCINYHQNEHSPNEVVRKIRAEGGDAVAMKADISKEDEVVRLFESIDTNVGRLCAIFDVTAEGSLKFEVCSLKWAVSNVRRST
jgi:NAD(P)-dependent dehydrogenase (short-subunit alcohol dehydrogenase family)